MNKLRSPTPAQALMCLEALAEHGEAEHFNSKKEKQNKAYEIWSQVYTIAHIARAQDCIRVHKSWVDNFWKKYNEVKVFWGECGRKR